MIFCIKHDIVFNRPETECYLKKILNSLLLVYNSFHQEKHC